jgi:hypothetical protein
MKRMLLALASSATVALLAPAAAAAHHGHHRHHGSHRHASSARILRFGSVSALTAPTTTAPTTTPTTPTQESAGKVVSFEKEVLTIMLNDKSTVSGKVTQDTQLRCQPATPPPETGDDEQDTDDESAPQGDEHSQGSGSGDFASQHGDVMAHSANEGDNGDNQNNGQNQESCPTTALTPGTVVLAAELKITPAGAVWEQVDIIH